MITLGIHKRGEDFIPLFTSNIFAKICDFYDKKIGWTTDDIPNMRLWYNYPTKK